MYANFLNYFGGGYLLFGNESAIWFRIQNVH